VLLQQTTAPGTNPFSQAVGTGIGAYAAYNMANRPASNINIGTQQRP